LEPLERLADDLERQTQILPEVAAELRAPSVNRAEKLIADEGVGQTRLSQRLRGRGGFRGRVGLPVDDDLARLLDHDADVLGFRGRVRLAKHSSCLGRRSINLCATWP